MQAVNGIFDCFRKSVLPLTACICKVVPSQDSGTMALTSVAAQSFLP